MIRRPAFISRMILITSFATCCRGGDAAFAANDSNPSGQGTGRVQPPSGTGQDSAEKIEGQEWPQLAKGVWQLANSVAVGGQKTKSSTLKSEACTDPTWLFATYWGTGTLEPGGCQFSSWQTSPNHYRIETVCMVRRVGSARMKGVITVETPDKFRMEAELIEGKKHIRIAQAGQRISNCTL